MILTLVALATSMFWFPAPERSDPMTLEFLAVEREYLTGDWTMAKVLQALLVPMSFAALGFVFWKRSIVYGLVLINAMVLVKLLWSFYVGEESGANLAAVRSRGLSSLRCGDPVRSAQDTQGIFARTPAEGKSLGSELPSARQFEGQRAGVSGESGPSSWRYSPECVEGRYLEVRLNGVLRSSFFEKVKRGDRVWSPWRSPRRFMV